MLILSGYLFSNQEVAGLNLVGMIPCHIEQDNTSIKDCSGLYASGWFPGCVLKPIYNQRLNIGFYLPYQSNTYIF